MSAKFKFHYSDSIKWPQRCSLCENKPGKSYDISGSGLSGLSLWIYSVKVKYKTTMVSVPVCMSHYRKVLLIRILYFVSFTLMLLSGIGCFLGFFMFLDMSSPAKGAVEPLKYFFLFL